VEFLKKRVIRNIVFSFSIFWVLVFFLIIRPPFNHASSVPAFNVIVIGWDGVQRNHFWECYNKELPECVDGLPNIEKLSGGIIFDSTITSGATSTKPGWAQILSGYNAEVMGIYDNSDYQPLPEDYSVFEKLENHFGRENIITLFIAGKHGHVGGDCPGDGDEVKGQPWCLTKKNLDYWQNKLGANENVGNKALELLETYGNKKFFAFFHFKEPDSTGHSQGENSSQYSEKIIDDDLWLGKIVRKLKNLGIYNQTFIYVITDHGFDEGKDAHKNAPFGFLASNDPSIMRSGDRKDLAPTILKKYGLSLEQQGNIPAVDGYPLDSFPPMSCVPEGEAFLDYPDAPRCCSGLNLIGLDKIVAGACLFDTGGKGDSSGYCAKCGDGICGEFENECNCAQDCGEGLPLEDRGKIIGHFWFDINANGYQGRDGEVDYSCPEIAQIKPKLELFKRGAAHTPIVTIEPENGTYEFVYLEPSKYHLKITRMPVCGDAQYEPTKWRIRTAPSAGSVVDASEYCGDQPSTCADPDDTWTATPFWSLKVYANETTKALLGIKESPPPSFFLSPGWNEIAWPEVTGIKASDIPPECPMAIYKENFWFLPYVKNYGGEDFEFESGKSYFLKCNQDTTWQL
jgi:hypothetical protein